ncbi:MAG TPA: ATP-binding protein, partial [Longimicrobiales bacterium]|nr:ATP-binding protein [Longimicrobiales bacterium]
MKTATTGTSIPQALDVPELESKLDAQHPWPGLEGYQEGDQPFFKGRSEEIEDLYRLVRRERLTLLVGKAGTGKSSLIRAGVFPKQRGEEALPIYVRLDYSEDAPALGAQVKQAVYEAARASDLEAPAPTDNQSLWEYLHLHDGEFWSRHHRIIMPFIVFDQFEELFTLGLAQHDSPRHADVRAFFSELSDLAEERVPMAVLEDPVRMDRHNLTRHHYKLLVCIREEYVAELDRMRDQLPPALFQNQMRLTEMTVERATQV